jgi:hypothetical protein
MTGRWPFHAIRVDPTTNPRYYGFYIDGFRRLLGPRAVAFGTEGVPPLPGRNGMAALAIGDGVTRRLYIDASDLPRLHRPAAAWADVYGQVNHGGSGGIGDAATAIVVPIGPSFGVRAWNVSAAAIEAPRTWWQLRQRGHDRPSAREHVKPWWAQAVRRVPEASYRPATSSDDYLFFVGWAWDKHQAVNAARAPFVRAGRSLRSITFEGGFAPRRGPMRPEEASLQASRHYPLRDYLDRLGRSVVALNTPAVHDCFGWKLGEYLALGKAVVSLPLTRTGPAPLVDGQELVVVDGSEAAIVAAVEELAADRARRHELERAARAYYDRWLRPDVVAARLLDALAAE